MFLFKYIYDKNKFLRKFEKFVSYISDIQEDKSREDFIITFIIYLKNNLNDKEMRTIENKVTRLLPPGNDLLEYFAQQNYKKGIEKKVYEMVENCILAGLDNKIIKTITGLSFKEIEKHRKIIENENNVK